jgi:hypothetical protein
MISLIEEVRPNRIREKNKTKDYHRRYARSLIASINLSSHQLFLMKSTVNHAFYKGDQWIFNEDLDAFLMDESANVRNRIKFVHNIVRPFVEFYAGTVIRMDLNFRAVPASAHAANRRDDALSKVKHLTKVANMNESFKRALKPNYAIGDSEAETTDMHQNLYVDEMEEKINHLITHISDINDFEDLKVILSRDMALDGIGVLFEEERHLEQHWDIVKPNQFFFDSMAKKPDLSDAEFKGDYWLASLTSLREAYPNVSSLDFEILEENAISTNHKYVGFHNITSTIGNHGGRVPVYRVYWNDLEKVEYGCVLDEAGYHLLARINTEESHYTDKDLIVPPDDFYEEILNNKDKVESKRNKSYTIMSDCTRFAIIVPNEYVDGLKEDLVLSHGIYKHSTKYSYTKIKNDNPYKVYCWSYVDGQILSPLDDLIDTQRYINRLNSIAEAQINNSRGSGVIYDKDMIAEEDGEDQFLADMNNSKPIGVNADGNLNNSVMPYDNTIKAGTFNIYKVVSQMKDMANDIFGGGAALLGAGDGYRVSVGAVEQNLDQATTTQEPFFYAISKIFHQAYISCANRGKLIYSQNERKLSIIVGDKGVSVFAITKDMAIEDFKLTIKRSSNPHQEKALANESLMNLLEAGLITQGSFSRYYGNIDMSSIGKVIRESYIEKLEAQRLASKEQEAKAGAQSDMGNIAMKLEDANIQEAAMNDSIEKDKDRQSNLDQKIIGKI